MIAVVAARERERAKKREYNQRYFLKIQQDPLRYRRLRQQRRLNNQRWRDRHRQPPYPFL